MSLTRILSAGAAAFLVCACAPRQPATPTPPSADAAPKITSSTNYLPELESFTLSLGEALDALRHRYALYLRANDAEARFNHAFTGKKATDYSGDTPETLDAIKRQRTELRSRLDKLPKCPPAYTAAYTQALRMWSSWDQLSATYLSLVESGKENPPPAEIRKPFDDFRDASLTFDLLLIDLKK